MIKLARYLTLTALLAAAVLPLRPALATTWPWTPALHSGKHLLQVLEDELPAARIDRSIDWLAGYVTRTLSVSGVDGARVKAARFVRIPGDEGASATVYDPAGKVVLYASISTDVPTQGGGSDLFPASPTPVPGRKDRRFSVSDGSKVLESFERRERYSEGDYVKTIEDGHPLTPPRKVTPREIMEAFTTKIRAACAPFRR